MKKTVLTAVLVLSVLSFSAFAGELVSDKLFQVALLQSLMQGEYDGMISVGELKTYGDIGIGTFQGVNGELIALDGKVYQAMWDGSVKIAPDDETVPFANVTFFDADVTKEHVDAASIEELKSILTGLAAQNGRNQFYMAKVKGQMPAITVRSELKQNEPYKPLNEALKTDQREFSYEGIDGTVVALYCPDYMDGLNTPGWHLHFVSSDGKKGGHVLTLSVKDCKVELDIISEFAMVIPNRESFNKKELATDMKKAIEEVEVKN
ncbi:MAG: acetolactate decarboxylase [Synergistaceae bacterium]|nr:acetolactate decarboxylase [Synergistaceae bacterium]